MALSGYPNPKVDLTHFYVSCLKHPLILTKLKVFLHSNSDKIIQILNSCGVSETICYLLKILVISSIVWKTPSYLTKVRPDKYFYFNKVKYYS
jgi:hypothetical protein